LRRITLDDKTGDQLLRTGSDRPARGEVHKETVACSGYRSFERAGNVPSHGSTREGASERSGVAIDGACKRTAANRRELEAPVGADCAVTGIGRRSAAGEDRHATIGPDDRD